jgi:hypothetical protein
MRIRALLFLPALAAVALGIGVSSASAATLFLSNNHAGGRVTVGATATATSVGNVDLTAAVTNRCTHIGLNVRVVENTVARSSLEVYSSSFGTCHPFQANGTHLTPWRLTVTNSPTMIGAFTSYPATLHNAAFDLAVPNQRGAFTGNLEGLTVTQTTSTTDHLCVDANNAGTATHITLGPGTIDAKFCLTGTPTNWSLT